MAITIIPAVQLYPMYSFVWRSDRAQCELYAGDLEAIADVKTSHIASAGLPVDATVRALRAEAPRLAAIDRDVAPVRPRGYSLMLVIDGKSGAIVETWFSVDPWVIVARRLGKAAA